MADEVQNGGERVTQVKPAAELSTQEIVKEARGLHEQFQQLTERYETAPPQQRAEIRQEMAPVVERERELREEFTGRLSPEVSRDRAPQQQIGVGY